MLADFLDVSLRRHLGLAEVVLAAPAMTRVDRKYLVPLPVAQEMLASLDPSWGVLSIGGRSTTTYRSRYFDSADLATARAHVQGRRRRWKARSRLYVEDGLCRMEVKAKDGRGRTVKTVVDSVPERYGRLSDPDRTFLTSTLAHHSISIDARHLRPTIEIGYERMTLARTERHPARMTLDWGVSSVLGDQGVSIDRGHVLVETKGGHHPSDADRLLAVMGVRPRSFSKYAAAASLLRGDIADNDVRHLVGRVLQRGPVSPVASLPERSLVR